MSVATRDVVFITVQYGNPSDTKAFLDSVSALEGSSNCQVIVVDNSPTEASAPTARTPDRYGIPVEILVPPTNLYYWGGAAFAIDALRQRSEVLPQWLIVCNNDVTIHQADFLTRLRGVDPEAFPIIGPAIRSLSSGRDQNPILDTYPGFLKRMKWRIYDVAYPVAKGMLAMHRALGRQSSGSAGARSKTRRQIYAPHGAFVIFSSAFLQRGGTLDTHVAMFAEELTLAETARELGLPIWYFPELEIIHAEHSTTGASLTREKYSLERMARRRYYSLRRTA